MAFRPVDIARKLGISTTTLRKYEEFGLVPLVSRSESGYRMYTTEHIAYFVCVREMLAGFSLTDISKLMKEVMDKKIDAALWMANCAQAELHQEKLISKKIIQNLGSITKQEVRSHRKNPKITAERKLTINDVSSETGIPVTTIRYWDKVGLISAERCSSNNYRMFTAFHIRQVLTIYALKFSALVSRHKHSIEKIKEQLKEFDYNDRTMITKMTNEIDRYLNKVNRDQITGIAALYHLCVQVETNNFG
ncbi:MAG TPA: MerR family transcriptional regulator [Clostridia bacterium]|nr:MerR family transcriptional regulator [Clostridia bacterium]